MTLPSYLQAAKVADKPIDYKWDVQIQNRIAASDADRKPALAKAVGKLSVKAAFAFGVACAGWVVARLSNQTDVADALLRLDAAWAATADARYAELPDPVDVDPDKVNPAADPVYQAMAILSDMHQQYLVGRGDHVLMDAYILALLAEHVAGRNATFKKWVPDVLKRLGKAHPNSSKPLAKEASVARELLDADPPSKIDLSASQARLLTSLDPARNPYLVAAADLKAAGIATPYSGKR
jgi:hypothetical protein